MESEPSWKQLRLSLERPYKDDHGNPIPVVEDITHEGEYIYETKENPSARLGANLRRIFLERGLDFFDRISGGASISNDSQAGPLNVHEAEEEEAAAEEEAESKTMTYEDLREMREEILKHLAVSLGEVTHAQQVLAALLTVPSTESQTQSQTQPQSSSQVQPQLTSQPQVAAPPNIKFAATVVSKLPPITSVQAFNAQLTIGGKDEALRHAASLFKTSAESMERTRLAGEKYWVDALRIRRSNWGLVPAPLPPGSATGKGADKTSKDFVISFGLEESPTQFRRRAVGRLSSYSGASHDMVFPYRRKNRLCVSIVTRDQLGAINTTTNVIPSDDETTLDGALRTAQCEIVEQEIFSILVQEAGSLPTASAKVSEQLIVIDAAQGLELQIELADRDAADRSTEQTQHSGYSQLCNLIYHAFYILLLRRHTFLKEDRLSSSTMASATQRSIPTEGKPAFKHPVLQPIIDLLQYQVFLERIRGEITQMARALRDAGIPTNLVMNTVGETGTEMIKLLDSKSNLEVGGEIILRIFDRHTVRFTFVSPSTLVAHLSQSTLTISSIPQLCQLLMDEVEQCLLNRVRDLGMNLTESMEGTWFIDLDHCIGRWEGCVLNFRVTYGSHYKINCIAYFLGQGKQGQAHQYPPKDRIEENFLDWARFLIGNAIKQSSVRT